MLFRPWDPAVLLPPTVLRTVAEHAMAAPSIELFPEFVPGERSLAGECGLPGPQQQIVGGEEATAHSFPWMAALVSVNNIQGREIPH